VLASRHGVAAKGHGPIGGRRRDYAWAAAGAAAIAIVGGGLASLHGGPDTTVAQAGTAATLLPDAGTGTAAAAAKQPRPTTRLGNLSAFAAITADVRAKIARNDLSGGKTRVKDLEVSWDDAEAGLKPRDPARWHRLDGEIDAVLTSLRAGNPNPADCAASLTALTTTLNQFDGV
jgi:hypothetical protein